MIENQLLYQPMIILVIVQHAMDICISHLKKIHIKQFLLKTVENRKCSFTRLFVDFKGGKKKYSGANSDNQPNGRIISQKAPNMGWYLSVYHYSTKPFCCTAAVLSPHATLSVSAHCLWETQSCHSSLFASETKRRRDAHLRWPDKSVMCRPLPSHLHLSLIHLLYSPAVQHTSTRIIRLCRTDIVCSSCASEQVAVDVLCLCWNP